MGEANPYEAPGGEPWKGVAGPGPPLTVLRAFSIVIASAAGFGAAGMGIGYGLGVVTPSYYRGVFANGHEPGFDPVQVGIGLGFSQGLLCGVVVGLVVILAVAISGRRRSSTTRGPG